MQQQMYSLCSTNTEITYDFPRLTFITRVTTTEAGPSDRTGCWHMQLSRATVTCSLMTRSDGRSFTELVQSVRISHICYYIRQLPLATTGISRHNLELSSPCSQLLHTTFSNMERRTTPYFLYLLYLDELMI